MNNSKNLIRRLILENLSARERYMQAMERDRENAGRHLDDLLAREQGYESGLDKSFEEMVARIDRENELKDRLNQMAREEVGLSDDYIPSENIEFMHHKNAAEEALSKGDDEEFIKRYRMMVHHGRMFDKSNPDAWKTEPGVDRLIAAMNKLESQTSLFDLANSPVLRSLGIMENKEIKLSRRKLRLVLEQEAEKAIKLSDKQNTDVAQAADDALVKAGGAADDEIVKQAVKDKTGVDVDDPADLEGVSRLASGDLVKDDEVKAIAESLVNRRIIKKLIRESLEQRLADLDKFKTTRYANKYITIKPTKEELTVRMSLIHDDIDKLRHTIKEIIKEMLKEQPDNT